MRKYQIILFLFLSTTVFSQTNLNDYNYVVVPRTFAFVGEEDAFQVNSLTKFLFNKYGFNAYFPDEVANLQRCDGVYADVVGNSPFIKAEVEVILKDCSGAEIFRSQVGSSKYKDFKKAYHDAFRESFESIAALKINQNLPQTLEIKSPIQVVVEKIPQDEPSNEKNESTSRSKSLAHSPNIENRVQNDSKNAIEDKSKKEIEVKKSMVDNASKSSMFELGVENYVLLESGNDFLFYAVDANKVKTLKAKIVKSPNGFIYENVAGKSYTAGFDASKNLVVIQDGAVITYIFKQ